MTDSLTSVGFLVMIVPLYQAELAHPSIRGRVTSLQQFMLGIGALIASWAAFGGYTGFGPNDSRQWRVSLGVQIVPAGLLAMLIMLFPESPRVCIRAKCPNPFLNSVYHFVHCNTILATVSILTGV